MRAGHLAGVSVYDTPTESSGGPLCENVFMSRGSLDLGFHTPRLARARKIRKQQE